MKKLLLLFLIAACTAALAQPGNNHQKMAAIVQQFAVKGFSGSVLVAEKGKVIFTHQAGMANWQDNIPVSTKSKFRICSITKTFTAVLILQLMEEGKLNLASTIGMYYPEYDGEAKDKVTFHQLLTYSSGIENQDQRNEAMYALQLPVDSIIKKYCSGRLVTEPGKQMSYKNADYIILGKIIEKITGKSYNEVLSQRILEPLKMKQSGYLKNRDIIPGLVTSYLYDSTGKFYNDDPFWIDNFYSSAAMYATAADLYKFDQALFTHQLLKKATVELMTTSYPELWGVAYSFWVNDQTIGTTKTKVMDRRGSISGNNTAWYHFINENKTIIVLSNNNATDVVELREKLAEAFFK